MYRASQSIKSRHCASKKPVTPPKRGVSDGESDSNSTPIKKSKKVRRVLTYSDDEGGSVAECSNEYKLQKALDACWKLGEKFKVPMEGFTFNPSEKNLEKIFAAYARIKKQTFLTYSNAKSFNTFGSRMLYAAICDLAELTPNFEPTGAAIWRHQWFDEPEDVRCLHGVPMFTKEVTYRIKADSERGLNALKKGEGELEAMKNEKDPPFVVVKLSKFGVCYRDQYEKRSGSFGYDSCGMQFSDLDKAYSAAKNAEAFNTAAFPNSNNLDGLVLLITCCECNYAGQEIEGRQTAKLTPWVISEARSKSMTRTEIGSYAMACEKYPYVFVFQCCKFNSSINPQGNRSNTKESSKPCDFRLSYTDAIKALVLVKSMIDEYLEPCKIHIPRFVWQECWRVKKTIAPCCNITSSDPNPFGE